MKKATLALLTAAVLTASTAYAATSTPAATTTATSSNGSGFYVGINGGLYYNTVDDFGTNFAGNLHAGYMFNQYLGLEVGGTAYQTETVSTDLILASNKTDYATKSFEGAVKVVYPANNTVSLFGKAGAMYLQTTSTNTASSNYFSSSVSTSTSASKVAPYVGGGLGFNLSSQFVLNLGAEIAIVGNNSNDNVYNTSFYYAGVDYHF